MTRRDPRDGPPGEDPPTRPGRRPTPPPDEGREEAEGSAPRRLAWAALGALAYLAAKLAFGF